MGDLISRQAVFDILNRSAWKTPEELELFELVKKLPSVTEDRKGKWIEETMIDGEVAYRCSKCNELFILIEGTPTDNMYYYCPHCGAEMENE